LLRPLVDDMPTALWGRKLTLGPAPEFCLHSLQPPTLPAVLKVQRFSLEPVWGEHR
jgi:hypothetical protein